MACGNSDHRTLEQVLFDQWGVPGDAIYFTMEGKVVGHGITCDRIAVGSTVVARGRLRGGTGAALRKLRGLLQERGVPMEQLDSRLEEIRSHVGEKGIKEAYESFDPWSKLKATCNFRLVKEAEVKAKPKQKEIQNNDNKDPMMETDPWAQAIRERKEWKLETSFFKLQDGSSPAMLDKLTHGARGIALISEKEAELLMKQQEQMSDQELAAVIFASNLQGGRFQVRDIQVPCRDVRAQMVNLGAKMVTIMGEDSKITIDEVDGTVLSCEIIRKEIQEWDEAMEGVVKLLKRKFNSLEAALFSTWGRKFFAKGKPVPDHRQAESCYVMLRIKREYRDAILRTVVPGIYMAPRNEGGAPDHLFKVVWSTDQNLQEVTITILANSEPKSYGLVRNKTGLGIRVKAEDFMKLKQKWQPGWKPQDGTPYGINIKCHYDMLQD